MPKEKTPSQTTAKRRRLTWRRAAYGLVILILLVIAADIALRYGAGLGNPVIYQADAACAYIPVANQDIRRFGSVNFINAFSQRSADLPAQKQPGHYRVLFIGDSVTYGTTYVDQADLFTSHLARDLPKTMGRSVDLMNASAGGWAVGNEVGYLQSRGAFGADVVIFVLNTGDLVQPFNSMDPPPDVASSYPSVKPWCALGELWRRYLWPRIRHRAMPHDAGSTAAATEPTTDVKNILASLDEARTICLKSNARMAIVYSSCAGQRWQESPYPQSLEQLRQWCDRKQVPLVDLQSAYAQSTPQKVYWDGTHLRPQGNRLAAQGIEAAWGRITGGGQ